MGVETYADTRALGSSSDNVSVMRRRDATEQEEKVLTRPRYQEVATVLIDEIAKGRWPVGSKMPTEAELCERFSLSRSTVRQSLAELEDAGLIERRQGSGATVKAAQPVVRYVLEMTSEADILRYASETILDVGAPRAVDAVDARRVNLGNPDQWVRAQGLRRESVGSTPIGLTNVFLHKNYASILEVVGSQSRHAIFDMLVNHYGLSLASIEQTITAATLGADEAEILQCDRGTPALIISRRYSTSEAGLIEVSESVHPSDRFVYRLRLDREDPASRLRRSSH